MSVDIIGDKLRPTIHYYSLVLNRERAMQTTAIKRADLERPHRLLIKLDPASDKRWINILRCQIILRMA